MTACETHVNKAPVGLGDRPLLTLKAQIVWSELPSTRDRGTVTSY